MNIIKGNLTSNDVDLFNKLIHQFNIFHEEISILSKKSPDNPVNKFKLSLINDKISAANDLLGNEFLPFKDFTEFDIENLPSNSDTVFIISQYIDAFESWRSAHIIKVGFDWVWDITGETIKTQKPTRYTKPK